MEGQMDVLFFNVLIFWFLRRGWKSGRGRGCQSKGCTVAKRLSSEKRKKKDREKESKCEGESI